MIYADKGEYKINGDLVSITFELNAIFEYFTKRDPEVLGGTLAVWGDKLQETLSAGNTNIELLDCAKMMAERYVELKEENSQ